jgi:phosphatidylinositol alpha-mannosyltransferase
VRIALVSEFYYPHLGGVTEHVHHLAHEFRSAGHEVLIVTSHMRGEEPDEPGVHRVGRSRVIFSNHSFARVTTGRHLARDLEGLFREARLDVVHVHGGLAPTFGLVAPRVAGRLDVPVVATFHSWFPRSRLYRTFRVPLQRLMDRHAAVIAVSEPVVEAMSRYFTARWDIIPNGVDVCEFHPTPNGASHAPRLLFLGRLDPRNGLGTVLDAMPSVLAHHPDARLVVAGDGPLRTHYRRLAAPLGDRVEFVGRVREERQRLYSTADLYLCPTTKASFGITLLEAMACGTPMLVSDIIGFRELVAGGAEARLVPHDDASSWAREVNALLDDPATRERMARAGRAKSATFAWPRVAADVMAVYRRVLP